MRYRQLIDHLMMSLQVNGRACYRCRLTAHTAVSSRLPVQHIISATCLHGSRSEVG